MSTKRYGITLDPDIYQWMRLESVKANLSVGEWITKVIADKVLPATKEPRVPRATLEPHVTTDPFDRLEKIVEQAKAPPAPKPLPVTPPPPGDRFGKAYPAPKPSSKKK